MSIKETLDRIPQPVTIDYDNISYNLFSKTDEKGHKIWVGHITNNVLSEFVADVLNNAEFVEQCLEHRETIEAQEKRIEVLEEMLDDCNHAGEMKTVRIEELETYKNKREEEDEAMSLIAQRFNIGE